MSKWRNKIAVLLVMLLGLFVTVFPCEAKENHAGANLISMDIENEPLRRVLKRISESADHEVTVSENWADMELTIRLDSVNLEKALKQIIVALGKPSHVILTDSSKRKTEILICADGPGRIEKGKDARVRHLGNEVLSQDVEVVPSAEPGERGITESELNHLLSKNKQLDFRNMEVIPPEEPGQKGVTEEELEKLLKQNKTVDPENAEIIPPEDIERGLTDRKEEKKMDKKGVDASKREEKSSQ
ncbi:MAG: hypothetical protein CVU64_05095 [Deltaproteobacteria bacterium HGW-Deltaproteobacteria-21]|nr:MAG: hypothetical protein CVU64_05095 [Deltaproteobacteria bacterium HGW-Deltaproteobacteria-21]